MAYFSVNKYLTLGVVTGIKRVVWEVASDKDFKNIIARNIKTKGDLFSCHMALQKPDGSWYEEDDEIYVRVKLYSANGESPWFNVEPNKAHLIAIWINDNLKDNIEDITKHRVGIIETDRKGEIVTEFEDDISISKEEKKFRREEWRKDY